MEVPPIDPTTRAIIAFIEVGVVGGVLILLITGKFRHDREIKREEKATADAEARCVGIAKQRDEAIAGWQDQTAATVKLGTGLQAVHGLLERLLVRNGRAQQ